jgi:hypothetical protein
LSNELGAAGLQVEGRPHHDVRFQRIVESVRQHRDHAMRHAIERQQPAHRVGPGVEVRAPDPFAHDRDARAGPFVRALERAAEDRPCAQDAKVVGAHRHRPDALGLAAIREVGPFDAVGVEHGHVQRPAVIAIVGRRQTGQVAIVVSAAVIDAHQAFRILVPERREDDAVQDAEHGGVGTDAERQGDDHRGREPRSRRDRAGGMLELEEQAVHMCLRRRPAREGWCGGDDLRFLNGHLRNRHRAPRAVTARAS